MPGRQATATRPQDDADADSGPHGLVDRTLAVIELLAQNAHGLPLFEIAERLQIPRSATHRLLASLIEHSYVRQERAHGAYMLTAKIASLGFMLLAGSGVTDLAQPILDRLARDTQELVRLAVRDDDRLTFVAKAQGSPQGLRYDPDMGQVARLSCSSSGIAWLSCLGDAEALAIVERQGYGSTREYGPRAPQSKTAFLRILRAARKLGYSVTMQTYSPWMAAMAAPVRRADTGEVTGTITVAGPHLRLTEKRMHECAPLLLEAADELSRTAVNLTSFVGRRATVFGN